MKYSGLIGFAIGACVGSVATYYYVKDKFAQIAQEEIDSVKAMYHKRNTELAEKAANKPDIMEYKEIVENNYLSQKESSVKKNEKNSEVTIITPDEFGMEDDYETITCSYYADGILADERDIRITDSKLNDLDIEGHFGEYEEDIVYVRDDSIKIDYEILRDLRTYSEVVEDNPYLVSDEMEDLDEE